MHSYKRHRRSISFNLFIFYGDYMPTYTNATTETKVIPDINNVLQHVLPNGSIQTYQILGTGWTETSATPIYNPVISVTTVTLSAGGVTVNLDANTASIAIQNISDIVTGVYTDSTSVTPPIFSDLTSVLGYIPSMSITAFKSKIRKLVLTGSGTCKVYQYR